MHLSKDDIAAYLLGELENTDYNLIKETYVNDIAFRNEYHEILISVKAFNYMENETPIHEKQQIESETTTNSGLFELIGIHKNINNTLKNLLMEDALEKAYKEYQAAESGIQERKYKKNTFLPDFRKKTTRWATAAAIVLLVAGSASVLIEKNAIPVNEKIYQKYYSLYTDADAFSANKDDFYSAIQKYRDRKFTEAFTIWQNMPNEISIINEKHFYQGLLYMEMEEPESATKEFENVLSSDYSTLKSEAYWYLSLCYLKSNRLEESKKMLSITVENEFYNSEKAKHLLQTID